MRKTFSVALLLAVFTLAISAQAQAADPHPSVRLTWTDADFALNPLMTFNVYRGTGPCGAATMTLLNSSATVTATTYLDTAVKIITTYCYDVTAVLAGIESGTSNTVNPSIPAANPTNLTAVAK
jgi:hypothetical protein